MKIKTIIGKELSIKPTLTSSIGVVTLFTVRTNRKIDQAVVKLIWKAVAELSAGVRHEIAKAVDVTVSGPRGGT